MMDSCSQEAQSLQTTDNKLHINIMSQVQKETIKPRGEEIPNSIWYPGGTGK